MLKRISNFYHHFVGTIPIFLTPSRAPLDYFIWSDDLFGISIDNASARIQFDKNSVLMFDYGDPIGVRYNPAYISWWALINLRRYYHSNENRYLYNFTRQVEWLLRNQKVGNGNAIVWPYDFDWHEGETFLKAPWMSAMSQGLAISCLIRAYRLQGDKGLLDLAFRASEVFQMGIEEGGVRTVENNRVFYEEYPAHPLVRILDGFVFGLLGLYDLYEETQNIHTKQLFDEGIDGAKNYLEHWDYRGVWSWYGNHGILSPPEYNRLNAVLMRALYHITRESSFEQFWKAWDYKQKDILGKAKTLLFLLLRHYVPGR